VVYWKKQHSERVADVIFVSRQKPGGGQKGHVVYWKKWQHSEKVAVVCEQAEDRKKPKRSCGLLKGMTMQWEGCWSYLHEQGEAKEDAKKVLWSTERNGNIVIADFFCVTREKPSKRPKKSCGLLNTMANMVKGLLMLSVCAAEAKEEAKVAELAAGAAATVRYDKNHSKGFSKALGSLDPKSKQFQEVITHPGFLFISYCVFWATLVSSMHTLHMVISFWKICFGISNRRWSLQCRTPVCSRWEFKFSTLLQELKLDQLWFFTAGVIYLTISETNWQRMVSTK